jgi:hypothetical protein
MTGTGAQMRAAPLPLRATVHPAARAARAYAASKVDLPQ